MRKIILFILITLCLEACTSGHNDYSAFKNLDPHGWAYGDTLNFQTQIDTVSVGKLTLALRHDNTYEYSNLWLEVSRKTDSVTAVCDTLNIVMADIYGRWNGKGIGTSFQVEAVIDDKFKMNTVDSLHVRHIMRCDTLLGITQVGLLFIADDSENE